MYCHSEGSRYFQERVITLLIHLSNIKITKLSGQHCSLLCIH